MAVGLARKLWTTEEYVEMIEKGILDKSDHVELIRGEIVNMAPIGMRHIYCVASVGRILSRLPEASVTILVQSPIQLPNNSMPEPDVVLLRGPLESYAHRLATQDDVILLVEVADTTLATDPGVKAALYAEAGIPEVWIVNLDAEVIEVHSMPANGKYTRVVEVGRGHAVELPGNVNASVEVDEVFGAR